MELQFTQVKNVSTKSLDVSLPPSTLVRQWLSHSLVICVLKNGGSGTKLDFKVTQKHVKWVGVAHTTLRCPLIYFFPLVRVVIVDYTLLSGLKKIDTSRCYRQSGAETYGGYS